MSEKDVDGLRTENAELRRLLAKHQWAGLTPVKSSGVCPECAGAKPRMAVVIGPAAPSPQC